MVERLFSFPHTMDEYSMKKGKDRKGLKTYTWNSRPLVVYSPLVVISPFEAEYDPSDLLFEKRDGRHLSP